MMTNRFAIVMATGIIFMVALAVACLLMGSVDITPGAVWDIIRGNSSGNVAWDIIVTRSRLPMIATAALSGAALAVAGLLLQTTFANPLAGPSILGVSGGAGLGVAVVMLCTGGAVGDLAGLTIGSNLSVLMAAWLGAGAVLAVLIAMAGVVRSNTMLLIVGVLVSYLTGSVVSLLNSLATEEGVHNYVAWGFGTFNAVGLDHLPVFAIIIGLCLVGAALLVKPLNAMLLGDRYAANLGVNVQSARVTLLAITGMLTATVTAYCGPIGFVGLVVPHIARLALATSDHSRLLPCCAVSGACVTLLCTLISTGGNHGIIPINALTPIIGVPVIIYIILNRRRISYFN